jgi:hypothetical protein
VKYLVFLAVMTTAFAGVLTHDVSFRPGQFELSRTGGYDIVLAPGMDLADQPGAPQLPVQPVTIRLPGLCLVTDVRIEAGDWKPLDTDIVPYPAQEQVPLSRTDLLDAVTGPDPLVYSAAAPWPARPAVQTGAWTQDGSTVVELLVHPLRYTGQTGLLEVCSGFRFSVEYTPLPQFRPLDLEGFEYVIITSTRLDSIFQRLADWKTQKGIPATIRHIDWVYANYTGRDNAEKLREYTKTLPDSGVKYVLLGGDTNVIPYRKAFAMVSEGEIHNREDSLPCDLYFADTDGDWDANHNDVFGEVADSVNLYPDLYIGRAPAENAADARAFVDKVLEYERNPAQPAQDKVLFFAEVMWSNPYTDGGRHKDKLEAASFPAGYNVTKRYQRMGNESRASVMAAMREGQNYLNHDGHGWIDIMSCGGYSRMRTRDCDTITNAYRGILFSIGCWTTAFDFNSIGEAWVNNPDGGGVAMIGNSSYGWGSPGNPGFGYSDRFDDRFWWVIQNEGKTNIGQALALSKAWYAPFSRGENVYRWHQYQLNLMGCPEMPVWTAVPGSLDVVAPADIPLGSGNVLVIVHDDNIPVENALVCLMKGDESYSRGRTDAAGKAWLRVSASTGGSFSLTVTAQNYLPHEAPVPVTAGAFVNFTGWQVNDSLGNDDGIANPGEVIALPIWMHNAGNALSDPVNLVLRSDESCISIEDSSAEVCPLNIGESLYIADAFTVNIGPSPEDGRVLDFDLVASDSAFGDPRVFHPVVLVGKPVLEMERYSYTSPPALPGETKALRICIENRGHGIGHDAWARLTSLDANVSVVDDSIVIGDIAQLHMAEPGDSFRVAIESTCPASYLAEIQLEIATGFDLFCDTFSVLVGAFGFQDDMESGDAQWTHGGTNDQWHLSTYRFHSDDHSWYCGDENGHYYYDNMDAWLITDRFMVAENCSLKFWRWFSVPNYGVDGIYVVVVRPGSTDTLDFIGTGGALGQNPGAFGIESDWYQQKYDLTHIPVGETIQVKISFKSDDDGDRGEGFYIDDFKVTGGAPRVTHIVEHKALRSTRFQVLAQPNPSPGQVMVRLVGAPHTRATGRIFDAAGRLVREFGVQVSSGRAGWTWDGNDGTGRRLAAGTYFIQAKSGDRTELGRVVLAR